MEDNEFAFEQVRGSDNLLTSPDTVTWEVHRLLAVASGNRKSLLTSEAGPSPDSNTVTREPEKHRVRMLKERERSSGYRSVTRKDSLFIIVCLV